MGTKARKARADTGALKEGQPTVGYADVLQGAPEDFGLGYKTARAWESQQKAQYFRLKNDRILGRLLDRELLGRAIGEVFVAIKSIILGSRTLNAKARCALLNRLVTCVEFQLIEKEPAIEQGSAIPGEKPMGWSKYQFERLNEIHQRSENFRLRNQRLEGELIERAPLTHDLQVISETIAQIVGESALSRQDKLDARTNLARLEGLLDFVVHRQNSEAFTRQNDGNGNGSDELAEA
jgi:hypothetical protein